MHGLSPVSLIECTFPPGLGPVLQSQGLCPKGRLAPGVLLWLMSPQAGEHCGVWGVRTESWLIDFYACSLLSGVNNTELSRPWKPLSWLIWPVSPIDSVQVVLERQGRDALRKPRQLKVPKTNGTRWQNPWSQQQRSVLCSSSLFFFFFPTGAEGSSVVAMVTWGWRWWQEIFQEGARTVLNGGHMIARDQICTPESGFLSGLILNHFKKQTWEAK